MERLSLPRIDCSPLSNSPEFEATILKAFFSLWTSAIWFQYGCGHGIPGYQKRIQVWRNVWYAIEQEAYMLNLAPKAELQIGLVDRLTSLAEALVSNLLDITSVNSGNVCYSSHITSWHSCVTFTQRRYHLSWSFKRTNCMARLKSAGLLVSFFLCRVKV